MNQESVIADIEAKALGAGLTIARLCEEAGVHPTTFSRWKRSERNPEPLGATLNSIAKLHDALDRLTPKRARRAGKVAA